MRNKILILIIVLTVLGLGIWLYKTRAVQSDDQKLQVMASFYPLAYLAEQIGGEHVQVTNLTQAGVEPHDFEPSAGDLARIESSDLVLVNGAGFEPWADDLGDSLRQKGVQVIEVSAPIADRTLIEDGETITDPHVWLSPLHMQRMADTISDALQRIDPLSGSYYAAGAAELKAELDELDQALAAGLASCGSSTIITAHDSFGYLTDSYGLAQVSITGIDPEQEPSTQQLAELTEFARANNIAYIFFETLVSPKLAETLATEVGAKTLVLDPLEGLSEDDRAQGRDYVSVMRDNLTNLQTALECRS